MNGRARGDRLDLGQTGGWYASGLHFQCTRCGECCRGAPGYVWVSEKEVARIARFLGMSASQVHRQFVRRVGSRLSLRERTDGDCVFYREECLIYPVRPTQCATFPFWESNVGRPDEWDRLAGECPGVNRGRLWSQADIDRSLRADRGSLTGEPLPVSSVTEAVLRELGDIYARVEETLANPTTPCDRCGECCRFEGQTPTLYTSVAEVALVLRWVGYVPAAVGQECPFLEGGRCRVYPVRPLGCRTFFCQEPHGEASQALHERALGELKEVCRRGLVTWRYGPFLELLREVVSGAL